MNFLIYPSPPPHVPSPLNGDIFYNFSIRFFISSSITFLNLIYILFSSHHGNIQCIGWCKYKNISGINSMPLMPDLRTNVFKQQEFIKPSGHDSCIKDKKREFLQQTIKNIKHSNPVILPPVVNQVIFPTVGPSTNLVKNKAHVMFMNKTKQKTIHKFEFTCFYLNGREWISAT